MQLRNIDFEETITEVNEFGGFIQEDGFTSLETEDDPAPDTLEPQSDSESTELESLGNGKETWTPEEQFRLLYAYFKEIGREPLLTPMEEIELSSKIKRYEARSREIKTLLNKLSKERIGKDKKTRRIKRLDTLMKAYSDRAKKLKERFMKANLRLVVSMARRYMNRGLPLQDLIQEGNIGLMRAVDKFDHTLGYKFSTYASRWILQSIIRALLEKARTIKVPVYILEKSNKVYSISLELRKKMGRKPLLEEIAKEAGIPVEHVKEILRGKDDVTRLDSLIGKEGKATLLDLIPDKESPAADSVMADVALSEKVEETLSLLTPREEEIVRLRFGIGYEGTYTLEEIGMKFNLSRERIRQLEKEALKKLANSEYREVLKGFLE